MSPRPAAPSVEPPHYLVFRDGCLVAEGPAAALLPHLAEGGVLVFDRATGELADLPVRPEAQAVAPRAPGEAGSGSSIRDAGRPAAVPPRPGRPKLGVVAREVTLLPDDWDWLARQPGGASVTLRRLVLAARRAGAGAERVRDAQAACYRFIAALAGNAPGFEEAARALFAADGTRFESCIAAWPDDVRLHALRLAAPAFAAAQVTAA